MNKKLIIAAILGVLTLMVSINVFADLGYYRFDLNLGQFESSSNVRKSDSEQKAYVTMTQGNLYYTDVVLFRDRRASDGAAATESKNGVPYGYNNTFTLNYSVLTGVANTQYYLNGYDDPSTGWPSGIVVIGQWNP